LGLWVRHLGHWGGSTVTGGLPPRPLKWAILEQKGAVLAVEIPNYKLTSKILVAIRDQVWGD
jgi:hypothetical protein